MKTRYRYLEDTSFLKELALEHVQTYLVKITVLNWSEEPVSSIEGRVISASLNIDGQSSMRRTANLSIAVDDLINSITKTQNVLSINKKITLEIGYVNTTKRYRNYDIFWFPLGTYVITSCSISHSESGLVASLQLQDKMCLLNGTVGGQIPAAAQFHVMYGIDSDGNEIEVYPTIYQIIVQLVNHLGGEQLGKIIISDISNKINKVVKWSLNMPLYYVSGGSNQSVYYEIDYDQAIKIAKNILGQGSEENPENLITTFQMGDDIGFISSDFTYGGQLVANPGQSIADILDQLVQFLGNYEYFYDLDGNFIFQEKKNFLNNSQVKYILETMNQIENAIDQIVPLPQYIAKQEGNSLNAYLMNMSFGTSVFDFEDSQMIKSYSNMPQYGAIKNDFVIWGIKKSGENQEWPIRYHLAIDTKPLLTGTKYQGFEFKQFVEKSDGFRTYDEHGYWVIPIILLSTEQEGGLSDSDKETIASLGNSTADALPKPDGSVVNRFYLDYKRKKIKECWKDNFGQWHWRDSEWEPVDIQAEDWRTQLLLQGAAAQALGTATNYYYAELKNEWPKIYDVKNKVFYEKGIKDPISLDYFLDFIDTGNTKINQLSIANIGRRSFVKDGGKDINCIFEKPIPDIVLINVDSQDVSTVRQECERRGQRYSQVSSQIYDNLALGGTYNSAYEEIRQTLHEFTSYNETISLQTVPLYFLEPNTRISVHNPQSDINGDYIIDSLSFALDNEGSLTINASKAIEKI